MVAGTYRSDPADATVCVSCPDGTSTNRLGAADLSNCTTPNVTLYDATLFAKFSSCADALTLYNSIYSANLTVSQRGNGLCNRQTALNSAVRSSYAWCCRFLCAE